ncbi:hypothetical protein M885DRAFT_564853 [Pelagophyceae sp. CCMP2097]|nr:hypothetical protein M885DRAFT_564853 [Pelagophyceae sp. CCMP2097]
MAVARRVSSVPKPCCVCAAPDGRHCTKCKSRHYCSKACQLEQCKQLAADFQDRMLDELMSAKLNVKEEPAVVADVLADGSEKRLSAVPAATVVKAAGDDCRWRGTCAICLDELPVEPGRQTFYACCCKRLCTACSDTCAEYDAQYPLCRSARESSVAQGEPKALYSLGLYHAEAQDLEEALRLFKRAAALGHVEAAGQVEDFEAWLAAPDNSEEDEEDFVVEDSEAAPELVNFEDWHSALDEAAQQL